MNTLVNVLTPYFSKTTAIMTAVIILSIIDAWLVSTEKEINRETVEKFLKNNKTTRLALIKLEAFLTVVEAIKVLFPYISKLIK